jgi:hypothetical protein
VRRPPALLNKDTDHEILLKTETIAAEVSSSNNPQNSIRQLEAIVRESEKSDLSVQKLEAMLVLAQVEIKSGHTVSGHAHLQKARKEAGEKGLQLIASRASLAEDRR